MPYSYKYPRPALTVDCVVFGFNDAELKILLVQRALEPFKGQWALPGGFVQMDENLDSAARRELSEETGLSNVFLEQLFTFGALKRDPRERVVSVAYYALVDLAKHPAVGASDASAAAWFPLKKLPALVFDHAEIVEKAAERLRGKVSYEPIGFELLPEKFSLSQLQTLYEAVTQVSLDKRNFRKKILSMGVLLPLKEFVAEGAHRPAQLFRFNSEKYSALKKRGFHFEL